MGPDRHRVRTRSLAIITVAAVLGLSCAAHHSPRTGPGQEDDSDSGPAGGAAAPVELEMGDAGPSLGDPGLGMFLAGPHHRGRYRAPGPDEQPSVLWVFRTGARVFASPVLGPDGTVFVGSVDGTFNAVDADGSLRWSYACGGPIFSSAAVSATGHVYVGCDDGTFLAFHPSGRVLWSERRPGPVDSSPAIGDDGSIYVACNGLSAVTPRGGLRWRASTQSHVFSPPAVHGSRRLVLFGAQDGSFHAVLDDGSPVFRVDLEGPIDGGPSVLETGAIVVGTRAGRIVALDPEGTILWQTSVDGPVRTTPSVGLDGNVYLGSDDGRLYALEPTTGEVVWRFQTGGPVRASAVVDSLGRIIVGSQDRYLYCLEPTGRIIWQRLMPHQIDSSVAIGQDRTLYVGCDDGGLYALR